ncbi:WbqC family protein [Pseudomonas syringae]|nr:WbqC family protein [Pseudomonas syringae]MBD8803039.1 WbqC family protein [Pseudomonas syringae]
MARTIAMMQPYLFPYLGYFQLINHADVFILGDDLQFIRAGWVNRNRILSNGQPRLLTFAVKKDHFGLPIMQRQLADDFDTQAGRLVNLVAQSYRKAPHFAEVMPLIERLIRFPQHNLALYAENALRELCAHLRITTPILRGSDLKLASCHDRQDRVINIAHIFSATTVLNPIGGFDLYERDLFARHGLQLRFFTMNPVSYPQFGQPFVDHLSIIDVLMFNSVEQTRALLDRFTLSEGSAANDPGLGAIVRPLTPQLAVE